MKLSSTILITLLVLLVSGLFASNLILKQRYNKVEKSDLYWNFSTILNKPFRHVKIDGGNITNIKFEQNNHSSLRVINQWEGYKKDSTVKAFVSNDTLHIVFAYKAPDLGMKYWMQGNVVLIVAAPYLQSITGKNTNFQVDKFNQKSLNINLTGNSFVEVESNTNYLDSLNIIQKDSSKIVIEMNPEIKGSSTISTKYVKAGLQGVALLDIGHLSVSKLDLNVSETSSVVLSGQSLKLSKKM